MNNTHTSTYLNKKHTYNVIDSLTVKVTVTENPYRLEMNDLFLMAARVNKKRSFLFVSKLLGKHIPIVPQTGLLIGALLAARYAEIVHDSKSNVTHELISYFQKDVKAFKMSPFIELPSAPVIIGFAETATALGYAFFECINDAVFFHTTREKLVDYSPIVTFEEEHSHATSHRCYVNEKMLNNDREVILVDDEITTGKTALNIIRSIQKNYPRRKYTVISILDWRSESDIEAFQKAECELGITIHTVSLLKGTVETNGAVKQTPLLNKNTLHETQSIETIYMDDYFQPPLKVVNNYSINQVGVINETPYLSETGRFALTSDSFEDIDAWIKKIAAFLKKYRSHPKSKTLCLGTNEFMYIPMRVSAEMGEGIFYHSTTRSPIHASSQTGYGANFRLEFPNPEDQSVTNYVYNIEPEKYGELFLFFEREVEETKLTPLLQELKKTRIPHIKIVFFNRKN
ncbi:phosphoribosyltransferase domain-containing protein [Bacillus aquiflavi]|uniref:Phosphoribosyltransferase domain-containing protein n=1 Tax=Bacillus aquiflavi TaxID=2672567 RepID=A0A6B3W242_9BACI|nr:phosphoribosyltransferase family protein [Bacillus aquiflavi]MBA4537787.1 phosphoribosyltransferase domain-containing protein [Bacillus aquiflavi]NEY82043.1 hypothetical protein [Bacillus aquiflavi]UAC46968.1 phosphoribosyltransferase family protein [Bacillus aquiflavi]